MWHYQGKLADIDRIPTLDVLDKPGFVYTDYMVDLPHDQTYLIENLLDPDHVSISHHGSQGNRKNAQPLEIEIIESSVQRIRGRCRGTQNPNEVWKYVDFIAPNQSNSYDRTSGI